MSALSVGPSVSRALGIDCERRAPADSKVRRGLKVVAFACVLASGVHAQCPTVLEADDVQASGREIALSERDALQRDPKSDAEVLASFTARMDFRLRRAGARNEPVRAELRKLPAANMSACFPLLEPVLIQARRMAEAQAELEKQEAQRQAAPEEKLKNEAWIAKAKDAIKDRLKDPRSAEFRRLVVSRTGGVPMVCGEVSSKNSFGGRNGFQRVVSAARPDLTFLEEEVEDMDSVWRRFC